MKIGVSSYSYSRCNLSSLEVLKKAREMGFEAIEFSGLSSPPEGETMVTYAAMIREEAEKLGIEIVNYAIAADFIAGSGGDLDKEIQRVKEEVKIAEALGVPCMRHDAAWGIPKGYNNARGFDDVLPLLVKGCRAVTEFAQDLGIKTTIENHGYFCQDSDRVEKLINGVNHSNFGLLLDIGNFLCVDEEPVKAVGRLLPYVFHVHVKDFHVKSGMMPDPGKGWFKTRGENYLRGAIIGHGDVPIIQCLRQLKNAGYDGTFSIEFEGIEDPILGISVGAENLRRYIKDIMG
ncbi:MAG: sugar phosphate isomerase/epimerase [Clostridiales bacterium]|nr:sugar phosphate isomerase/epimerase [Clostridiales bacterium]